MFKDKNKVKGNSQYVTFVYLKVACSFGRVDYADTLVDNSPKKVIATNRNVFIFKKLVLLHFLRFF